LVSVMSVVYHRLGNFPTRGVKIFSFGVIFPQIQQDAIVTLFFRNASKKMKKWAKFPKNHSWEDMSLVGVPLFIECGNGRAKNEPIGQTVGDSENGMPSVIYFPAPIT